MEPWMKNIDLKMAIILDLSVVILDPQLDSVMFWRRT